MAFFCAAINRDLVSFLRFPLQSHVQIILYAISLVGDLKYTFIGFSSHFYFLAKWVFANSPGDQGSILGQVIPKTQKMVLDASLLSTQHYKVRIKGKVEQSSERSHALP